jgi:niacin transporter
MLSVIIAADKTAIMTVEYSIKEGKYMNSSVKIKSMTIAALLSAIGIIIPMYSPLKIVIEPASFTFASHVPIFIAMFISPTVAVFTSVLTALGFLLSGVYPIVVVFRALSHVIFAFIGAYILKKKNGLLLNLGSSIPFVLLISVIHAVCEVAVSTYFYFDTQSSASYLVSVILLVGVGTLIHSTVDFIIASAVWVPLQKVISVPANAKIRIKAIKTH